MKPSRSPTVPDLDRVDWISRDFERAVRTAPVFRVSAAMFNHMRLRFNYIELHHAQYPFDIFEIIPDLSDPTLKSSNGEVRMDRIIFQRNDDVHLVRVRWTVSPGTRIYTAGAAHVSDLGSTGYTSVTERAKATPLLVTLPLEEGAAANFWLSLVNLCHLLARRDLVDMRRVDAEGRPLTRQQSRAAARDGGQEIREIVLRPGVSRRTVQHAISQARIALLRAHPRRHGVSEHHRRYHTKAGTIVRAIAAHQRGGKLPELKQTYDARKLPEA